MPQCCPNTLCVSRLGSAQTHVAYVVVKKLLQAFFSVVVHTKTLKKVQFTARHDFNLERESYVTSISQWRWFLYAFFSKASTSSVVSVGSISSPLLWTLDDVDVASVVDASYPATQLLVTRKDEDIGTVHFEQGTEIIIVIDPFDTIEVKEPGGQSFEIIHFIPGSTVVHILVPGYGSGNVRLTAGHKKHISVTPPYLHGESTPSTLKYVHVGELLRPIHEPCSLVELRLPCLGRHLKGLRACIVRPFHDELLEVILTHCPNLESLDMITMTVEDIQLIQDAYESDDCRLSAISMREWEITDHSSFFQFLEVLSNPTTIAAKRLQQLELSDTILSEEMPALLLQLLRSNQRLYYVKAYLPRDQIKAYHKALEKETGDPHGRKIMIPLPMETKMRVSQRFYTE